MKPLNQKTIERVVSQRALHMGSSFACQICVVGFLCGVCLTSLFLAALTSFGKFEFGGISSSSRSVGFLTWNSSSEILNVVTSGDCNTEPKETTQRRINSSKRNKRSVDERVSLLCSAWSSALLDEPVNAESEILKQDGKSRSSVPKAPHLENCKLSEQTNERLDKRAENESFPPWTIWKGRLDIYPSSATDEQLRYSRHQAISEGAHHPWIMESDEENYPLTKESAA